jgi:CBS-domain-containing membrane protein
MDLSLILESPRLPLALANERSDAPRVTASDPARRVMTDLRLGPVGMTEGDAPIDVVLATMKRAGVRFLFVADEAGQLVGSITSYDIQGEKPMQFLQSSGSGRRWQEVLVRDIMEPVGAWRVLDERQVDHITVAQLIGLMVDAGRRHLVVVETPRSGTGQLVRGLFSATRIQQLLGVTFDVPGRATTFAEIGRAIG